jgi:hypothetical protein
MSIVRQTHYPIFTSMAKLLMGEGEVEVLVMAKFVEDSIDMPQYLVDRANKNIHHLAFIPGGAKITRIEMTSDKYGNRFTIVVA